MRYLGNRQFDKRPANGDDYAGYPYYDTQFDDSVWVAVGHNPNIIVQAKTIHSKAPGAAYWVPQMTYTHRTDLELTYLRKWIRHNYAHNVQIAFRYY